MTATRGETRLIRSGNKKLTRRSRAISTIPCRRGNVHARFPRLTRSDPRSRILFLTRSIQITLDRSSAVSLAPTRVSPRSAFSVAADNVGRFGKSFDKNAKVERTQLKGRWLITPYKLIERAMQSG